MRYQNDLTSPRWSKKAENMRGFSRLGFSLPLSANEHYNLDKATIVVGNRTAEAVKMAARDLKKYFNESCAGVSVNIVDESRLSADEKKRHLIVVGNEIENGFLKTVKEKLNLKGPVKFPDRYYKMTGVKMADPGNGFAITTRKNPYADSKAVFLLEGEDRLGIQYAIYDFAEEVLGVRYYSVYFDYIPAWKAIIVSPINKIEMPEFPLRQLEVWNYTKFNSWDIKKNKPAKWVKRTDDFTIMGNDPLLWYYNALKGDAAMMKRVVDWLVKNKQNVITWLQEHLFHFPPYTPLDYAEYEAMRGIKIIGYLSTASSHTPGGAEHSLIPEAYCRSKDGEYAHHLCYNTKRYWETLEKEIQWYTRPENRLRQIVCFNLYYGEGGCAYPAYCINDRSRKKCFRCGHIPNWKKWTKTMAVAEKRLKELGFNVPISVEDFGCASSGNPPVDDSRFGVRPAWDKKLIENTPAKNNFFTLRPAGDHTYEEMGHYWPVVKKENKKSGKKLTIFKEGESILMMRTDTPLMSPYYFYARDHDFEALAGDSVTIGHDTNIYTTRYLEWFKQYHAMQNQWRFEKGWQKFVTREVDHLFGKGAGKRIAHSFELVSRLLAQELKWKNTPYNHNAGTWRGIQTRWGYLRDIFVKLADYSGTLMEIRNKKGGLYIFAAGYPLFYRVKRRPFGRFIEEAPFILAECNHYLGLIDECETDLRFAEKKVLRNKYLYQKEVKFYVHAVNLFLRWRLLMVRAYSRLVILAKNDIERMDKKTMLATLAETVRQGREAVRDLAELRRIYGKHLDDSWGGTDTTPQVDYVKKVVLEWEILSEKIENMVVDWQDPIRFYFGEDYYPSLFGEKGWRD